MDVENEFVQMMAGYFYRYPAKIFNISASFYGLRIPCMQLVIANLKLIGKYEKDWNRYLIDVFDFNRYKNQF